MKVVYIAHPISGDVESNLNSVSQIVLHINKNEPNVVPFAPYYLDCLVLDDSVPEERGRGIKNDTELLKRKFVDEIWLYGNKISSGMIEEIILCNKLGIKVVPMTPATSEQYDRLLRLIDSTIMGKVTCERTE